MKKDLVFFGDSGLTSTSANHIANMAKETYLKLEEGLKNFQYYNENISLINSSDVKATKKSVDVQFFDDYISKIEYIGNLKSLIAWLREAIAARDRLKLEVNKYTFDKYVSEFNLEFTEKNSLKLLTEDEYYGSLSIKERNRYYWLETQVSNIGKYIHDDSILYKCRKGISKIESNPIQVTLNGSDSIITEQTLNPGVSVKIDEMFFKLQNLHRTYQSELNSMKFKCEEAISKSKSAYLQESQRIATQKEFKEQSILADYKVYIKTLSDKILAYKIVIPNHLLETYKTLSK